MIEVVGQGSAKRIADVITLRAMLYEHRPAAAIVDKAVELVRAMADRPEVKGMIGKQLSSIVLPRTSGRDIICAYHATKLSRRSYIPDLVVGKTKDDHLAKFGQIVESNSTPNAVPKVHKNAPCPCNSGKRYRNCHGLPTSGGEVYFYKPPVLPSQD